MSAKLAEKSKTRHQGKVVTARFPIPLFEIMCQQAESEGVSFSDYLRQAARKQVEAFEARAAERAHAKK